MTKESEERDEKWADWAGRRTFLFTLIITALFAAAVLIYIH